jgi:Protein of unknown function (DUF2721)
MTHMDKLATITELKDVFVPLVLGCISLIAWLVVRNDIIANRIRAASEGILKRGPRWRLENLRSQIEMFKPRYDDNNKGLALFIWAIICFFGMIVASVLAKIVFGAFFTWVAVGLLLFGMLCVLIASWFALKEVRKGRGTLFLDADCALDHFEESVEEANRTDDKHSVLTSE